MSAVFSFECSVVGKPDWGRTVNARSRGKAKVEYWRDVSESWPDLPYTAVTARKVGGVKTSAQFSRNAEYRGFPGLRCGQRVKVGSSLGVIVGHNESANFNVLFDDDAPKYAGMTLNVHPGEVTLI